MEFLVGEIAYLSEVTRRLEPLPITVSIAAAPGMRFSSSRIFLMMLIDCIGHDLELIDLVNEVLKHGGKPQKVATGRSIF